MKRDTFGRFIRTAAFFVSAAFCASAAPVPSAEAALGCLPPVVINKTVIGFAGHEWVVIGYDGEGVFPRADSLTLLLKNNDAGGGFGNAPNKNAEGKYEDGNLWAALDAIARGFDENERALINVRELIAGRDDIIGAESKRQFLWPLSLEEWGAIGDASVRAFGDYWQLRSLFDSPFASDKSGSNGGSIVDIPSICAIRPALSLNLSSVVFAPYASGAVLKFAVLDKNVNNLNLSVKDRSGLLMRSGGGTVSLSYSGAKTGGDKAVTAVIADARNDEQMIFRRSNRAGGGKTGGVFSLAAPDSSVLPGGSYKLFIFNERMNADYVTNSASDPIEIPLTVDDGKPPSVVSRAPDEIFETTPALELVFSEMVAAAPGKKITITEGGAEYYYALTGDEPSRAAAGRSAAKIVFSDFKGSSGEPLSLKLGMECSVTAESGAFTDMTGGKTPENMGLASFSVTEPVIIY
jgi:hypothetical protein